MKVFIVNSYEINKTKFGMAIYSQTKKPLAGGFFVLSL